MFKELVKKRIKELGLSRLELSVRTELSRTHLVGWLNGRKDIKVGTLEKILEVLGWRKRGQKPWNKKRN